MSIEEINSRSFQRERPKFFVADMFFLQDLIFFMAAIAVMIILFAFMFHSELEFILVVIGTALFFVGLFLVAMWFALLEYSYVEMIEYFMRIVLSGKFRGYKKSVYWIDRMFDVLFWKVQHEEPRDLIIS
jgi:hypothetical protein